MDKMKIKVKDLDPLDSSFISIFQDFCLDSKPLPGMQEGSLSQRLFFINNYRKELCQKKNTKIATYNKEDKPLLFSFFHVSEDHKHIVLDFISPNIHVKSTSNIIDYQTSFCLSLFSVFDKTGLDLVKSDINRSFKRKAMIRTLQRFVPCFDMIRNDKGEFSRVEIKKENVNKFYEKIKTKSDRNKLDNKGP